MKPTAQQWYTLMTVYKVAVSIGEYLGLKEEDLANPNCDAWIIDRFKQLETAVRLTKTQAMQGNSMQNIQAHSVTPTISPLDEKPI